MVSAFITYILISRSQSCKWTAEQVPIRDWTTSINFDFCPKGPLVNFHFLGINVRIRWKGFENLSLLCLLFFKDFRWLLFNYVIIVFSWLLTLSRLGVPSLRRFAFSAHISLKNGPIRMIRSGKMFIDVLSINFACSIMQIGPLVAEYAVDLIADFVRATLTLRFSPNFGTKSK